MEPKDAQAESAQTTEPEAQPKEQPKTLMVEVPVEDIPRIAQSLRVLLTLAGIPANGVSDAQAAAALKAVLELAARDGGLVLEEPGEEPQENPEEPQEENQEEKQEKIE